MQTFHAIIQGRSLRLCDVAHMNDSDEGKYGAKFLLSCIQNAFNKVNINIDLLSTFYPNTQETLENMVKQAVKNIYYTQNNNYDYMETKHFACCFSKNGDLLSQWRAYGNDGCGISIGFDFGCIQNINAFPLLFRNVVYTEQSQINIIQKLVDESVYGILQFLINKELSIESQILERFEEFVDMITNDMAKEFCFIKNPYFCEEKEARLLHSINFIPKVSDCDPLFMENFELEEFELSKLNFYTRNDSLVSYVKFSFDKAINTGIVSEIIIGSKSKSTLSDVYYFLKINGYDADSINIRKSLIPMK